MEYYRILKEGEVIEAGDECDACANNWHDEARWEAVPPHMVGRKASNPSYPAHTKIRRRTNITKDLDEVVKNRLFEPVSPTTLRKVEYYVSDYIKRAGCSVGSTDAAILWKTMSKTDKLKWFICNKVFPWVGLYIRDLNARYAISVSEIPRIPCWAEASPKNTVVVDCLFTPPKAADKIEIKCVV